MALDFVFKLVDSMQAVVRRRIDRLKLNKIIGKGLRIGKNVYIGEKVELDYHYPFLITIEDNCHIAKKVRVLVHDATTFKDLGVTRIALVNILEGSFIGENAIILPGVTIGPRAFIAPGAVVNRDIGEKQVAWGNPARPVKAGPDQSGEVLPRERFEAGGMTRDEILGQVDQDGTAFIKGFPCENGGYVNSDPDDR